MTPRSHALSVGSGTLIISPSPDKRVRAAPNNVPPEVWRYEGSGKQVLVHWFSYRKKDRTRPVIGERRPPSPLEKIQPDRWLAEYTTELLNVLHVLGPPRAISDRIA